MAEIEVKLKGIAQLKAELRELKSELANATDPQEVQRLAEEAGKVADRIKDVNEQANAFASGSPFERSANALGEVKNALFSLDFEKASQRAQLFNQSILALKPDVFSNAIKGLTGTVFNLGKAFMSIGAALLTNPIFLIAAAIVGIVTIIGVLLNKLGLLKPILNAIGEVFKFVKKVIDAVIQSIKDFLDWLGLTSFAAEEAAERQAKAQEKVAQAYADKQKQVTTAYDQEIRLANIAGEDTTNLERKKQEAIIETSRQQYKALEAQRDALRAAGVLTAEQSKQINDAMKSLREGIQAAKFEIKAINAQEVQDNKKKNDELLKSDRESYKKRLEEQKKHAQDRLAANRLIRDLELELLQDGIDKELKLNKERYKRLIEDTRASETLQKDEKEKIIQELFLLESRYASEIAEKYVKIEKEKQDKITEFAREAQEIREQLEEDFLERYRQNTTNAQQLEIDAVNEKYFELIESAKQYNLDITELEKRQKEELEKVNQSYRQKELEKEQALQEAKLNLVSGGLDATANLIEAFAGKSESQQKRAFEMQKAVSIAQAVMDTYKGANAIFASAAANPASVLFPAQPFIQAGLAIAAGIANVKKIASTQFGGGAPSAGGGATGGGSSVQAMQPNVNLFGQGNNMNTFGQSQSVEQGGTMVVQAVVSETEITSTQNKINKMKLNAEL